jgi:nickel-dependent lactate racemase
VVAGEARQAKNEVSMRIGIAFGQDQLDVEVREEDLIPVHHPPFDPPLGDPAAAVRAALESPRRFPALRQALTPDDHIAVVVDERVPGLPALLTVLLEHLVQAHIAPEAITLVCSPPSTGQPWVEELPDAFQEVRVEIHDPHDRRRLSYLATTREGRRLYLNRTVVDADQVVVLARRRYDPLLGYAGAEGALYPALSDEETLRERYTRLSLDAPGEAPWPLRREAVEAAWLLGAPFFIQIIEGAGEAIIHVVAGLADTSSVGQRLLDARWRLNVDKRGETVIASVGGDPARQGFSDLASALACAARVVQPNGRIVLLSGGRPALTNGGEFLQQAETPHQALDLLRRRQCLDTAPAFQWASAARRATVYLLSGFAEETAEALFTVPLEHARQVQRLLDAGGSCLYLADAHKTMAVVTEATD